MRYLLALLLLVSSAMAEDLPNPQYTPGMTLENATMERVCVVGYSSRVRDVSRSKKKRVFALYDVDPTKDKYEVDHLISLQLGGSNDVLNLWPQSYTTKWNAKIKDKLENKLRRMVCDGVITLDEAQMRISNDWIKTYCEIYTDRKVECDSYLKGN